MDTQHSYAKEKNTWNSGAKLCSRRYFGLARNLIRCIISPNQDDLSYSSRTSFPGRRNWVSCQTHPLWLNNAAQCRCLNGGSSIAATAWRHEGTYLTYGFLAPISDQGIPVEYELDTFNTSPQEQLYVTTTKRLKIIAKIYIYIERERKREKERERYRVFQNNQSHFLT